MKQAPSFPARQFPVSRLADVLAFLCLGLVYCFHFAMIATYAVNLPYCDEWDAFPRKPYLSWLWEQHNEHRIVTTKMIILGLYWLNGWNIYVHQILNFIIFGITLGILGFYLKSRQGLPFAGAFMIMTWMLSPMLHQNHDWGFQTQFHLALLFLLLAICAFFNPWRGPSSWRGTLIGAGALLACILSFSSGIPASIAVGAVYSTRKILLYRKDRSSRELWQIVCVLGSIILLVAAYMVHFEHPVHSPALARPWSCDFITHFLTLISCGFGMEFTAQVGAVTGTLIVAALLYPWLRLIRERQAPLSDDTVVWSGLAFFFGLMAVLFAISMGRASFGWTQAYASRYREFSCLLVPIGLCGYYHLLPIQRTAARSGLAVITSVAIIAWLCSLPLFSSYKQDYALRIVDARLVRYQYLRHEDGVILDNYPGKIPNSRLEEAWQLKLSFTRAGENTGF
jgi:hypothetical protein